MTLVIILLSKNIKAPETRQKYYYYYYYYYYYHHHHHHHHLLYAGYLYSYS